MLSDIVGKSKTHEKVEDIADYKDDVDLLLKPQEGAKNG